MPTGSSEPPRSTSALAAPASTVIEPWAESPNAIQSLRGAISRRPAGGTNLVPTCSPAARRASGRSSEPEQITLSIPAVMRMRLARILVIMPPVPTAVVESPADPMMAASILSTRGMNSAAGSSDGLAVYRPSMSESVTHRSAETRQLTSAASVSLSPNLISSTAVVSFSFTTGTTPKSSRRVSASRACRYELRRAVSLRVRSTSEVRSPAARNSSS